VILKYAGGEPLLCFPLIIDLHKYAQSLSDQIGITLDGVILSNGTFLTSEIIRKMLLLNLRLMISLDGLGGFHDCQRPYADGRGSFENVWSAVELALAQGLVPDISVTISNTSIEGLPDLITWILESDLPFSLNFCREHEMTALQGKRLLNEEMIVEGMLSAFKVIEADLPQRSLLASLIDRANLASLHRLTCGVGHSYLVFNCDGQLFKCHMQMGESIGDMHAGDPIAIVRNDVNGITNVPVDEKAECWACEWRYWCTGGCPLTAFKANARYDTKSPYCNIYRALYPEVVRLEGLRLLKYEAKNL
jgi:uncharacterized protein